MLHLDEEFVKKMKDRLLLEKQRLEEELKSLLLHTEIGSRDDDNALEAEEDDINRGVRARLSADLEKIVRALAKIEDGTYGMGIDGEPIPKERLEALPWADKAI